MGDKSSPCKTANSANQHDKLLSYQVVIRMLAVCSKLRSKEHKMAHTMTTSSLGSGRQSASSVFAATGSGDGSEPDYKHEDNSVCSYGGKWGFFKC
jgi:hypothetical protein